MSSDFSVRKFLAERQALIVHSSTPMRSDDSRRFPDDLIQAQHTTDALCCSTILSGDKGPYDPSLNGDPGKANAPGCVGIVLDVNDAGSVLAVHPSDCGTHRDGDGILRYDGDEPTAEGCAKSIDRRTTNNEWVVQNFRTIGLLVFNPTFVHTLPASSPERQINLETAIKPFPDLRVFSARNGEFIEYNRKAGTWSPVQYDDIVRVAKDS
jgi:hypothetical protein